MLDKNVVLNNVLVKRDHDILTIKGYSNCASTYTFNLKENNLSSVKDINTLINEYRVKCAKNIFHELYGEIVVHLEAIKEFNDPLENSEIDKAITELLEKITLNDL